MGRACSRLGTNVLKVFAFRSEEPLGGPKGRWEENNKIHLKKIG
jgi:hypothetical protein